MRHFLFLLLIVPMSVQAGGGDPVIHANSTYERSMQEQHAIVAGQIAAVEDGRYNTVPTVLPEHSEQCSRLYSRYVHSTNISTRANGAIAAIPAGLGLNSTEEYLASMSQTEARHTTMASAAERDILALPLIERPDPPNIEELRAILAVLDGELHRMGSVALPVSGRRSSQALLGPRDATSFSNPRSLHVTIPDTFPACGHPSS